MIDETAILQSRILLIDDQTANLRLLEALLHREGFSQLLSVSEPDRALTLYSAFDPDLVVLDLMMPKLDGYAVLEQLSRQRTPHDFRPVLVVTADATTEARHRALALGAKDFLTKPFDPVETMLRIWNLLETRWLYRRLQHLAAASSGAQVL
jgi:DNA-binding response OmpR family regulator